MGTERLSAVHFCPGRVRERVTIFHSGLLAVLHGLSLSGSMAGSYGPMMGSGSHAGPSTPSPLTTGLPLYYINRPIVKSKS